jgi:hypothetical protein
MRPQTLALSPDGQLLVTLKGLAPKGGFDGRPLPIDFGFEAPGLLEGALTGSTEVRVTSSLIRFNNVNGNVAGNRFSGWASVDVSNKPLVKVELDFQKLDIGTIRPAGSGSGTIAGSGIAKSTRNSAASLRPPWLKRCGVACLGKMPSGVRALPCGASAGLTWS